MAATDETLLVGMATGDAQAAAMLVRRYQARVYGLALTIVGVPATAEDVAQEAFIRAWRFAAGYDPRRGPVLPWLLTITRNAAVSAVRLNREQLLQPDALAAVLVAREVAESSTDRVAETEHIRTALRELPSAQATAVVLATFYGLTAQEIADRCDVPLGTVKTRIRLGLARLRDNLKVTDD